MRGQFQNDIEVFELKKKVRDLENKILDIKGSFDRRQQKMVEENP